MIESWKAIPGYEEKYEISNYGNVRSLPREQVFLARWGSANMKFPGKIMRISKTPTGYNYLSLSKDSKNVKHLLHRLVMLSFVGPSDLQVNHKDGNKDNNRLDNLEYCTCSENHRHCIDVLGKKRGENNYKSKFTESQVLAILGDSRTAKVIAQDYGVSRSAISMIKSGKNWSHVRST